MSPFPLLRLPRLVLFEVFKSLSIESSSPSAPRKSPRCRIDGHIVPVMPSCISITTFWKNHQEGFLTVIQHLLKMFQCKISTDYNYRISEWFHSTISKLFDLQVEFKRLTIKLDGSEDQKLLWNQISCSLGLVENLSISSVTNPSFRPDFTSWPLKISIWSSAWVTLESFLTCTSTRIEFGRSHLRNKDVNEVLRKWKSGGFPNLEYLYIEGQSITNNGTPILGMKLSELDGKDIQTDDGSKKANVRIRTGCMRMSVTPFQ